MWANNTILAFITPWHNRWYFKCKYATIDSISLRSLYLFNKIQYILVINKFNVAPIDFFCFIFLLLHLENMLDQEIKEKRNQIFMCLKGRMRGGAIKYLIKMLLELFISKIDAQLLKASTRKSHQKFKNDKIELTK